MENRRFFLAVLLIGVAVFSTMIGFLIGRNGGERGRRLKEQATSIEEIGRSQSLYEQTVYEVSHPLMEPAGWHANGAKAQPALAGGGLDFQVALHFRNIPGVVKSVHYAPSALTSSPSSTISVAWA